MTRNVGRGREAFAQRAWAEAHAVLGGVPDPDVDDLERLAVAAHLLGLDEESGQAWERMYDACVAGGDSDRAVRCTFWMGITLMLRGETARAGGWLARGDRLAERCRGKGAGHGFLLLPRFLEALAGAEHDRARDLSAEVVAIAQRFDDRDLLALGVLSRGQASIAAGETDHGLRLLDEAMVYVTEPDVSPITTGIVYCGALEFCMDVCDLRRAREWTESMTHWCAAQPDLVPYRGQCLVHRSQILQACGAWADAAAEAERARRRLSEPAHPALGLALYQQAELHRLRGELPDAERAYRAASERGVDPSPGFALLRLAQGSLDAASAGVRRMVDESHGRLTRPIVLAAAVEVLLAAGERDAARAAGHELVEIAATAGVPLLGAVADYAAGIIALADDASATALGALRRACSGWRELEMPYEMARARVQIALACRAVGDRDAADLELQAAAATFVRLGARPELDRLATLARPDRTSPGLTAREREVLRLIAGGQTNREIAAALVISEHTVARHVQNILAKIGVPSRAAATAFAYRHGLVPA